MVYYAGIAITSAVRSFTDNLAEFLNTSIVDALFDAASLIINFDQILGILQEELDAMIVAFNQANNEEKAAIIGTLIGSTIDPFSKLKGLKFARMMRGSGRYTIKVDIDVPNNRLDNVLEGAGSKSWGNPDTLQRHFDDHGGDFGAIDPPDYANKANNFYNNRGNYQVKVDADGVTRVYDPNTNTFGSYNPDGTTKTFFKPTSPMYFDRQPGQ